MRGGSSRIALNAAVDRYGGFGRSTGLHLNDSAQQPGFGVIDLLPQNIAADLFRALQPTLTGQVERLVDGGRGIHVSTHVQQY
jgi:hypothetical protein